MGRQAAAGNLIDMAAGARPSAVFDLEPLPPFRLDLTAWALRRRPGNLVDRWEDGVYRRAMYVNGRLVEVSARQVRPPERAVIEIQVAGAGRSRATQAAIASLVTRMLGLGIDLVPFYRMANRDPVLGPLAAEFRGLKPPRLPSVFETLVNAIACQQLTLTVGLVLLNRLAETCRARSGGAASLPFPRAGEVARLAPRQLRTLGFSRQKVRALRGLAAAADAGEIDLESLEGLADDDALDALCRLRGIGRWSAEYVLLRGLGRLSVFPGDDVGARNNLEHWLKLRRRLDYHGARRRLRRWEPYAGLVYFHLLLRQLAERGYVR